MAVRRRGMQVTRRYWAIAGTGLLLAVLAVAFARPLLLIGAASLGAWLLGRQYLFVRALSETTDTMTIEQFPAQDRVVAGNETPVTLAASLARPATLAIDIEVGLPVSATGTDEEERTLDIAPGDERADTTVTAHWAVAGSYELPQPMLTLGDADGLFIEQLSRGPTPSIVVEPQGPRNIHVGEGGEQLMAASLVIALAQNEYSARNLAC